MHARREVTRSYSRDTVHKEMEKLSDDLQAALKRVAALEAALQASREEQRAAALQVRPHLYVFGLFS